MVLSLKVPILTLLLVLPLAGAIINLFLPATNKALMRYFSLVVCGLTFGVSLVLLAMFDYSQPGFQFVEKVSWIKAFNVDYYLAVDGVSLPMLFITTLLTFIAIPASWKINHRVKEYFSLMLLLEVGMIGVFIALDFMLFYVFWEMVLIPMYFMIGIWGGANRQYAAIKFFLYTFIGSIFMLAGILALYLLNGATTFSMLELAKAQIPLMWQKLIFLGMFLGFAVKVPIVPFHTWLPDAHVEAPTAASVILAGVLLKMGTYAFIRIGLQVIPQGMQPFLFAIGVLGVISIIYGAFCAMVQKDLKKLVAYSSVSHMGFVMLGIASFTQLGVSGAVVQMFSHGMITGMLFLLVGSIYERTHTRIISELGGLITKASIWAAMFIFIGIASMGAPSLSGFVGEFLVIIGSLPVYNVLAIVAGIGVLITAGYMIWTMRRVCLGAPGGYADITDLGGRELAYMLPLSGLILVIGIYPQPLLRMVNPSVAFILNALGGGL